MNIPANAQLGSCLMKNFEDEASSLNMYGILFRVASVVSVLGLMAISAYVTAIGVGYLAAPTPIIQTALAIGFVFLSHSAGFWSTGTYYFNQAESSLKLSARVKIFEELSFDDAKEELSSIVGEDLVEDIPTQEIQGQPSYKYLAAAVAIAKERLEEIDNLESQVHFKDLSSRVKTFLPTSTIPDNNQSEDLKNLILVSQTLANLKLELVMICYNLLKPQTEIEFESGRIIDKSPDSAELTVATISAMPVEFKFLTFAASVVEAEAIPFFNFAGSQENGLSYSDFLKQDISQILPQMIRGIPA
jgi:hypothetical protein